MIDLENVVIISEQESIILQVRFIVYFKTVGSFNLSQTVDYYYEDLDNKSKYKQHDMQTRFLLLHGPTSHE